MTDWGSIASELAAPLALVPTGPGGRIAADVPCARCGYNLRSLLTGAFCPECALAVGDSIVAWRSVPWKSLRLARIGLWVLIVGFAASSLWVAVFILYSTVGVPEFILDFPRALMIRLCVVVGMFLVVWPAWKARHYGAPWLSALAAVVGATAALLLEYLARPYPLGDAGWFQSVYRVFGLGALPLLNMVDVFESAALVTAYIGFFRCGRWLAVRLRKERLARWSRVLGWVLVGLTMLVAVVVQCMNARIASLAKAKGFGSGALEADRLFRVIQSAQLGGEVMMGLAWAAGVRWAYALQRACGRSPR